MYKNSYLYIYFFSIFYIFFDSHCIGFCQLALQFLFFSVFFFNGNNKLMTFQMETSDVALCFGEPNQFQVH